MKHLITLFLIISVCSPCFAASMDFRISDGEGDVADISPTGELVVSKTVNDTATNSSGAPDRRISDNDGEVVDITVDGKLTLSN